MVTPEPSDGVSQDPAAAPARPSRGMPVLVLCITLAILATCVWLEFQRLTIKPFPPRTFAGPVEEFKYGSIGAETNGYPYVVWRELPTIFRSEMPGGWRHFGFLYEQGHDLPIGISVRRTAVDRVGFNCATCHAAAIQIDGKERLVLGAPAAQLDIQAYLRFLARVGQDPRLSADAVIESAARNGRPLGWVERQALRLVIMPRLLKAQPSFAASLAWMDVKSRHGPGRTDAGNAWRERWGLRPGGDAKVGTVDFPSVWNQRSRLQGWFHWDGDNNSLDERNYSAALAGGATEWLLDRRKIGKVSAWLLDLKAPRFPSALDAAMVPAGRSVFVQSGCAACHQPGIGRTGQVTDIDLVGTDPQRALLFDDDMVRRFRDVGKAYTWRFSHYRSTHGYANMPLDGVWARSPYLHNGSVPNLMALLTQPAERPARFYRGCRTYDVVRVGYACNSGFLFDTRQIGNSNAGHTYGTDLPLDQKRALIAYLGSL